MNKLSKIKLKLNASLICLNLIVNLVPIVTSAQINYKFSELSQEIFEKGQVTLAKDQLNNAYLITKNGYFDIINDTFHSYIKPIDTLFQRINNIHQFNTTAIGEKIYFINPSGGYVFEFDKNTITRIDNSMNQRAYFNSRVFTYKGQIYLVGGYGYWEFKSHLLRFDFDLKEWFLEDKLLEDNLGLDQSPFVTIYNDKLYVVSIGFVDNFKNLTIPSTHYITYDLKTKTKQLEPFDFSKISNYLMESPYNLYDSTIAENQNIWIYSSFPSPGFLNLNFEDQDFNFFRINVNYFESISNPIKIGNNILSLIEGKTGQNDVRVLITDLVEIRHIGSFKNYTKIYLILLAVTVALFLISYYFFTRKTSFTLLEKKLSRGLASIKINYEEYYFLNYLAENSIIENQVLIDYFDRDNKSYDLNVKRKNTMIEKLEYKIQSKFKTELFKKALSPKDKRQGVYVLVKKLKKG